VQDVILSEAKNFFHGTPHDVENSMKPPGRFRLEWPLTAVLLITNGVAFASDVPAHAVLSYSQADVTLLIAYVAMALVFSFLCSVAEAVLLSTTPSYIEGLREAKPKLAALLKRMRQDDVDQSLAAILTLNTVAHTVGAILAGAQATRVFGSTWIGVFSGAMTLAILFLTEIVPKTLGTVHWRRLAPATAVFVLFLTKALYPLVWLSVLLTKLITRGKAEHLVSREEILAMASLGEQTGRLDEHESRIIRNLFRFGFLKTADIMTPRTVVSALQEDLSVKEAMAGAARTPFSRLPLYSDDIDTITGFVLREEMLVRVAQGQGDLKLKELRRDLVAVWDGMPLPDLLESLLSRRQNIALVVDEYGGTRGIVTMEDAVETLLGMEIVDEMDATEDMRVLARQQWEKRARVFGIDVDAAGGVSQTRGAESPPAGQTSHG
jgi:CBS domain containing-hemolysin-like protein